MKFALERLKTTIDYIECTQLTYKYTLTAYAKCSNPQNQVGDPEKKTL